MKLTKNMRFQRWRKDNAIIEQPFMRIATLVGRYLSTISLSQIKKDVDLPAQRTKEYQHIQQLNRPNRGVLLYCILDIEEAIDLLSNPSEKTVLSDLKVDLVAMYNDYTDTPASRINNILKNFKAFLGSDITLFSNQNKAKELYSTIYLALCIVNNGIIHRPMGSGLLAKLYKIDIKKIHNSVKVLIKEIEDKIMMFDKSALIEKKDEKEDIEVVHTETIVQQTTVLKVDPIETVTVTLPTNELDEAFTFVEPLPLPAPQQAIQKHFNEQYRALFLGEGTAQEKLKSIIAFSRQTRINLQLLIEKRKQEATLVSQVEQISDLLDAFIKNDHYIIGRKYFLELKKLHAGAFDLITRLATSRDKQYVLLENIEAQKHNTKTGTGLYILSTVFSPLTALSRAFLTKKAQHYIDSWTPETLDAQAKTLIKELATEVLLSMRQKLEKARQEKQQIQSDLCSGTTSLDGLITAASSENLEQIAALNEVTPSYDELVDSLVIDTTPVVQVKTQIQDVFQQRYVNLMHAEGDEKGKIDNLIVTMRTTVKSLNSLIELNTKKDALLLKINSLKGLMNVFNHNTTNKSIGPVPNEELKQLQIQLLAVNKEINQVARILASGNETLNIYLQQVSIQQLHELVDANDVADPIDKLVLSVVTHVPVVGQLIPGEKTVQDYFSERYSLLLSHDEHDEEYRLAHLARCIDEIDRNINIFVAIRADYQLISLKANQVRDVLNVLESNKTNSLLTNLTKERLQFLEAKVALAKRKVDSIAHILAAGKTPLKELVLQEHSNVLLNIVKANQAAKECIEQYKLLKDNIALLCEIRKGTRVLDNYVVEHYTWWVKLTNFLSQFFSMFKTNSGKMIDSANELKEQLIACRKQCEQEITAHIAIIREDCTLGDELLGDLPERHDYHSPAKGEMDDKPFDKDKTLSLLAKVSLFGPKSQTTSPAALKTDSHLNYSDDEYDIMHESCCSGL